MNKKRLTILRDALIEHAKNPGNLKFDLDNWATVPSAYRNVDLTTAVCGARLAENFCGTSACAMGLAASLPEFNRAGLKLDFDFESSFSGVQYATVILEGSRDEYGYAFCEFGAAKRFFGLSEDDVQELFNPSRYTRREGKNPLAVADKITALLEVA